MAKAQQSLFKTVLIPWSICLLAALFYCYDFLLRVMPSVMIHPLMHFYHVGAFQIGLISAFYYYAYTPMQLPAGIILDRHNPKWVLFWALLACVLGTLLFMGVHTLTAAYIARAMMGFGSAFAFIGALKLGASWLPSSRFALFTGVTVGLGVFGAMSADIFLSRLVVYFNWRTASLICVYIGAALLILIAFFVKLNPNRPPPPKEFRDASHIWKRVLAIISNWKFWNNGIISGFLFLPVSVFASLWGVAYLKVAYHLTPQDAATAISLVFFGTALGAPLAGWISDKLKRRKPVLFAGTLINLGLVSLVIYGNFLPKWIIFIALFLMGISVGAQILAFVICRELIPIRGAGTLTAMTNFIVTLGGAIFQPLIGFIYDHLWKGHIVGGVAHYTIAESHIALSILPVTLILAFFLIFLLPETYGKLPKAFTVKRKKHRKKSTRSRG